MADEHAIWEAIEELKRSTASHAVKHAEIDGELNLLKNELGGIRAVVNLSRTERKAQFETLATKMDAVLTEVSEERGARRLKHQLIGWIVAAGGILSASIAWFRGH